MRVRPGSEHGAALLLALLMMLVLAGLATAVGIFSHNSLLTGKSQLLDKQAFYTAEAGWQRARQALMAQTWTAASSPGNTYTESFGPGEYRVTIVDNGDLTYTITAEGYIPNQTATVARRQAIEANVPTRTNLSLTATALASSSQGNNLPSNANDGSTATAWVAGTMGSGSWLAMDFGSATTLNQIIIRENDNIDGLTVESSTDASTWTTVSGLSVVESPAKRWTANFSSTSARYFRARFTSVPSNKRASVQELESYNTSGAVTLGKGTFRTQW